MTTDTQIKNAAIDFCLARKNALDLKAQRRTFECTSAYEEDGETPCWAEQGLVEDDICEQCKQRIATHSRVLKESKKAAAAWRKFKRLNNKSI